MVSLLEISAIYIEEWVTSTIGLIAIANRELNISTLIDGHQLLTVIAHQRVSLF